MGVFTRIRSSVTSPHDLKLAVAAAALSLGATSVVAADMMVPLNESRLLELKKPAATVIVGNPAVANVSVEDADLLFVLGRSYGSTTITALDEHNRTIATVDINVVRQRDNKVTLFRGTGRSTFACTPDCVPVLDPGDAAEGFETLAAQTERKSGIAQTAATGSSE